MNYSMWRKSLQTGERRPERTAWRMEHWPEKQRMQDEVCRVLCEKTRKCNGEAHVKHEKWSLFKGYAIL